MGRLTAATGHLAITTAAATDLREATMVDLVPRMVVLHTVALRMVVPRQLTILAMVTESSFLACRVLLCLNKSTWGSSILSIDTPKSINLIRWTAVPPNCGSGRPSPNGSAGA